MYDAPIRPRYFHKCKNYVFEKWMLLSSRQEAVDISLLKKEQREGVDMLVGWRVGI